MPSTNNLSITEEHALAALVTLRFADEPRDKPSISRTSSISSLLNPSPTPSPTPTPSKAHHTISTPRTTPQRMTKTQPPKTQPEPLPQTSWVPRPSEQLLNEDYLAHLWHGVTMTRPLESPESTEGEAAEQGRKTIGPQKHWGFTVSRVVVKQPGKPAVRRRSSGKGSKAVAVGRP